MRNIVICYLFTVHVMETHMKQDICIEHFPHRRIPNPNVLLYNVPCDIFILRNNNTQNKRKNSIRLIAHLPIDDR